MYGIRPARPADMTPLHALLTPARASGELRPRPLTADAVLVAEDSAGRLVGAVALLPWTAEVGELCSLYSALPGSGLGTALTAAATAWARARGFSLIVALTHRAGFFSRRGFSPSHDRPWARARGLDSIGETDHPELPQAVSAKAAGGCSHCPRLGHCRQELLVHRLAHARRRACA